MDMLLIVFFVTFVEKEVEKTHRSSFFSDKNKKTCKMATTAGVSTAYININYAQEKGIFCLLYNILDSSCSYNNIVNTNLDREN